MEVDVGADVGALVSIAFAAGIDSHINALSPDDKRLRSIFLKKIEFTSFNENQLCTEN